MLDQVLEVFNVAPEYDLSIMKDRQTLFDVTTNILNKIGDVLDDVKPDVVLVHGDTSTTFVTALACFYKQIPVDMLKQGLELMTSIALIQRSSTAKLLESLPSITLHQPKEAQTT